MRCSRLIPLVPLLAVLLAIPAQPQGPAADWRTLATQHFRVHYPAPSEAWARRAAARLESIRERVVAEVGYEPPEVVDVLVSDPVADPNGQALPFVGWPRLILWTSPPGPESEIGHYADWPELLIVHEETHLVHLLRPSRNPLRRLLAEAIPLGPIALRAPRWVIEGYATVVEGRLTGLGRPNGDLRAAILRRWAQAGKLPSYDHLASDTETWKGGSMAYLMGSAYLEWLEERAGPGSLRNLWARMTARTPRRFDDAFRGVFGESPADLYDRFRAELTWRAYEAERRSGAAPVEGELWQDLAWGTGAPTLSSDGERIAIILRGKGRATRLVVWSAAPDEDAERHWRERQQEILKRDPEDVPAKRTKPLPLKVLHSLEDTDGREPTMPRWMPDGRSILFVRFEPDAKGFLHPDLFSWVPETREVRRLTYGADLRDPDPAPDGRWAVAVRNRNGSSQVVRVDLESGAVSAFTLRTVEEVYDRPRVSPDGRRIAYALHREGAWRLAIREIDSGRTIELEPPPQGTVSSPAWSPDGKVIYAVVGIGGFIDLYAFPADMSGAPVPLTRAQAAALAPAPTPDGTGLFFLSLEPGGLDLRRLTLPAPGAAIAAARSPADLPAELAPAVRPSPPESAEPFAHAEVPPGGPYGLGRQELFPLFGGSVSEHGGALELGLRGGDVVGRLDWLLLGSLGESGWPSGGAVAAAWRGSPTEVGLHLFHSRERPTEGETIARRGNLLDLDRQGLELSASRRWERPGGGFGFAARALWDEVEPASSEALEQRLGALALSWNAHRRWVRWRFQPALGAHYEVGHTEGSGSWSRWGGAARLRIGYEDTRLALSWRRDTSRDLAYGFDLYQLGGGETSLLPESALANRIAVPALPMGARLGEDHEGQRAELELDFLPAPLFYERHRLWGLGGAEKEWLSLAGIEYRFSIGPLPIGRLPAFDLRAGVAQILDDPLGELDGDIRWWLITAWRP